MADSDDTTARLGNEPPLTEDGRSRPPDRRDVSLRWLAGTFLTGLTSSVLMGMALFAALDGREQLATPPEIARIADPAGLGAGQDAKAARVRPPQRVARARDRRRLEVSTLTREGDRDVVRMVPFVSVRMVLAAGHEAPRPYPPFDPLAVFAEEGAEPAADAGAATAQIYGAKVEGEVSLRTVDFPLGAVTFDEASALSAEEAEKVVRSAAAVLADDGAVQVAALHYVDPQRFGAGLDSQTMGAPSGVRIVPENLSVAPRAAADEPAVVYAEEIIPFAQERLIAAALAEGGYEGPDAQGMAEALGELLGAAALEPGSALRLGLEVRGEEARIVRAGVYDRARHLVTVALDDREQFVPAAEPEPNPELLSAFDDSPLPLAGGRKLPSVYDGIFRAALAYGLSEPMTRQIVRLLAAEVDFQSRLSPSDRMEVLFSQPDENDGSSVDSELLFVRASFGGAERRFYRFRAADGTTDFFDADGRSARQFLLRNPVPNGQFRSGFGGRRHPILGYSKAHTGVDWSAPRGTPIIAAGNGVVEKAGWSGGYGRQTIIRHANGYETSYSHQSAIVRGVKPGAKVRQGQVIGYVGSTGLSTGNHLHYELIVNGRKVDPMRVRLPGGRALSGADLDNFKRERERIDDLVEDDARRGGVKLAASG